MFDSRDLHVAVGLSNRFVLVAGGADNKGFIVSSAEIFDRKTRTFSAVGSMSDSRAFFAGDALTRSSRCSRAAPTKLA